MPRSRSQGGSPRALTRCALLAAAVGCAAAPPRPEGGAASAETCARVFRILELRHAGGAPPSPERSVRHCTGERATTGAAEARALDALAKAFDPHSGFVTAGALAAQQRAIHEPLPEAEQARGRLLELAGRRIGWIALPSFYLQASGRSAARDIGFLAARLLGDRAELLVLDLRGNGGGVIEEALRLCGVLGVAGAIAREQRKDGLHELRAAKPRADAVYAGPLAVLVDAGTAGVSEVFAAAVADRARGTVIGARTRGHGSAQTLVLLQSPKGAPAGGVRVTDRYFVRLGGEPIEGRGVVPDHALDAATLDRARPEEALAEQLLRLVPAAGTAPALPPSPR